MFGSGQKDCNFSWSGILRNLSGRMLEQLRERFREQSGDDTDGLDKETFSNIMSLEFGNSIQSNLLFDAIVKRGELSITWNNFIEFFIQNIATKTHQSVFLSLTKIEYAPHMNRETIVKIVLIETNEYFCYTMISKHGRVGLYDGNLNFLTSYQVIMAREDINRSDDERRRRNRWITDAVYCADVLMFIVTNSARSIIVYEASGLKHVPYWLIIGVPDIIESLSYKNCENSSESETDRFSVLFCGDGNGDYKVLKFVQPNRGLLRRKHTDNITLFYWEELKHEMPFVCIENWRNIHGDSVRQIDYCVTDHAILSCSKDPNVSVVKTHFPRYNCKSYVFKMERGCDCFYFDAAKKLLVTCSENGIIRLWNSVIVSKPIAFFLGHKESIVDSIMMINQQYIISLSRDGVLKLWDMETSKCLQTLKIMYPSFDIEGKIIEFGRRNIYPGPKRHYSTSSRSGEIRHFRNYFGYDDVIEKNDSTSGSFRMESDKWERSCLLATCCNHIATVKLTFENIEIETSSALPIALPPPLQNSVLIPSNWRIAERPVTGSRIGVQKESMLEKLQEIHFVLDKHLFDEQYNKYDINYRIAKLESQKLQMQHNVEKNAPYSALDILEIEELTLSANLPIPENKKAKNISGKTKKILANASLKNQIFSEPSSSRSKSSRSSIVEFSY